MKKISVIEAMKLRHWYDASALGFCKDLADIHGCIPAKGGDLSDFYDFLNTIFNAGRIDGIRGERARRKARKEEGVRFCIHYILDKIKSDKSLNRIYGYMLRHYDEEGIAYEHINSHIL